MKQIIIGCMGTSYSLSTISLRLQSLTLGVLSVCRYALYWCRISTDFPRLTASDLKRFSQERYGRKLNTRVDFPLKGRSDVGLFLGSFIVSSIGSSVDFLSLPPCLSACFFYFYVGFFVTLFVGLFVAFLCWFLRYVVCRLVCSLFMLASSLRCLLLFFMLASL